MQVINLRSIRPLDRAAINTSVRKTNRLVTVEEGFPQHGVGAEIWLLSVFLFQYYIASLSHTRKKEVNFLFTCHFVFTSINFVASNSTSVIEECFEYLDAAVERIAGADVCMPYAANLERMAVPQVCVLFSSAC